MLSVSGENHIQFTWIQHIIFTLMVPIYRTADRNVPTHILYSVRYVLWDIHCTLILTPGNNLVLTVIWMICVKVSFSFTWDFQLVHFGYVWIPAQHNTGQVFFSVLRGHSVVSSSPQRPMTSDFEGFLYQILCITLFSYLNSWDRASISVFNVECQTRDHRSIDRVLFAVVKRLMVMCKPTMKS